MTGVVERVDALLATCLDERAAALSVLGPDTQTLIDAARTLVLDGGKRLRPRFAYWGWRCVRDDGDDGTGLVAAAASLELLHACALVHDDVMDASDTRRGRPAAHVAFARLHQDARWRGDSAAFGAASALVLGDLLLGWADGLFAVAPIDAQHVAAARQVFAGMRELVMAGQYLDVLVQAQGRFCAADALRVIEYKTSKYTVEGPLHLGATIAGAPAGTLAALSAYGLPLGEAFQLRDDVLGVFGDPDVTGKPAGDDLREGKQTLLTAYAMERADDAQAGLLRRDLGDRTLDAARIEALREVVVGTGALERVEQRIAERAGQARAALDSDAIAQDARAGLAELVAAATSRRT